MKFATILALAVSMCMVMGVASTDDDLENIGAALVGQVKNAAKKVGGEDAITNLIAQATKAIGHIIQDSGAGRDKAIALITQFNDEVEKIAEKFPAIKPFQQQLSAGLAKAIAEASPK